MVGALNALQFIILSALSTLGARRLRRFAIALSLDLAARCKLHFLCSSKFGKSYLAWSA
jgi:hypothetical protein